MSQDISALMALAGFKLFSASEPGIYVRDPESAVKDTIDWTSPPTELLDKINRQIEAHAKEVQDTPVGKSGVAQVLAWH